MTQKELFEQIKSMSMPGAPKPGEGLSKEEQVSFNKYKKADQGSFLGISTGPSDADVEKRVKRESWLKAQGYSIDDAGLVRKGKEVVSTNADLIPGMPEELKRGFGGYAKGGIASGNLSGYQATLHGTEAVVPLPDNRSIPVTLDSSSLNSTMQQQNQLLTELLSAMNKNNNLTSGILQNSY